MLMTWFQARVVYERTADDGNIIKVAQSYIVDALSFSEAENKMIEEVKQFVSGEFRVDKIKRSRIQEIFFSETGDRWYRAKVNFITYDEYKGVEKLTANTMLVQACTLKEAVAGLIEGMSGTLADYDIHTVTQTDIIEVFKYEKEEKEVEDVKGV